MQADTRHTPGRIYGFVVVTLAVLVIGITYETVRRFLEEPAGTTEIAVADSETIPVQASLNASTAADRGKTELDPAQEPVSRSLLVKLMGIAGGIGLLTLLPSRKPAPPASDRTRVDDPEDLVRMSGLNLLGSILPGKKVTHKSPTARPPAQSGLTLLVSVGELILFAAVVGSIYACWVQPEIAEAFLRRPLDGYAFAVARVASDLTRLI